MDAASFVRRIKNTITYTGVNTITISDDVRVL
jgi:hypothetical protein